MLWLQLRRKGAGIQFCLPQDKCEEGHCIKEEMTRQLYNSTNYVKNFPLETCTAELIAGKLLGRRKLMDNLAQQSAWSQDTLHMNIFLLLVNGLMFQICSAYSLIVVSLLIFSVPAVLKMLICSHRD